MYNLKSPFLRRIRNKLAQIYRQHIRRYAASSYAQEGEDLILAHIFGTKGTGFYVDVGAFHPHRFSNTYRFYRRGWRGINMDAMPGSMTAFRKARPRDINLEIAVAREPSELTYYMFSEGALNTLDAAMAQQRQKIIPVQSQITIRSRRLEDVLDEYLPKNQSIDFMSVDVEGLDLDVLQSNDWQQYRPTIVLAESLGREGGICDTPIERYLAEQGYKMIAHTLRTGFYQDKGVPTT